MFDAPELHARARRSCIGADRLLARLMAAGGGIVLAAAIDKLVRRIADEVPALGRDDRARIAAMLPVLQCGEESAVILFAGLAARPGPAAAIGARIVEEERQHVTLIAALSRTVGLPPAPEAPDARGFFRRLAAPDSVVCLSEIAAIDAITCRLLGSILRGPLGALPVMAAVLGRIRADEAGHVRLCRRYLAGVGIAISGEEALAAASGFLDHLDRFADALAQIGVDMAAFRRAALGRGQ